MFLKMKFSYYLVYFELIWGKNSDLFQFKNFENADFWIRRLKTIQKFPGLSLKNISNFGIDNLAFIESIFNWFTYYIQSIFLFFLNFNSRLDQSFLRFWTEATVSFWIYFL